jgi:hypothetical protein
MPGKIPETKLFSVDMGKGAFCDCGKQAETQFVISTGKGEAKRLAVEAKKARAANSTASDVCCGLCIAKRIAAKGLFITEMLKYSPIKFERVTLDLPCLDCSKPINFGDWAHFHSESSSAICVDCGAKRGWSDKAMASHNAKLQELKTELSALRKRVKVEAQGLYIIEEKIELHQIGENYKELEKQIEVAIAKLWDYFNSLATSEEKATLKGLEKEIRRLQNFALEIKREIDTRLFWLDKNEQRVKVTQGSMANDDEDQEQRLAPQSHSEVQSH